MKQGVNIAESVLQRLRNLNKQRNEDFNFILIRYAIERLLYRLTFIRRSKLGDDKSDFTEVMKELRNFLLLPLSAASENKPFTKTWKNGESWTNR